METIFIILSGVALFFLIFPFITVCYSLFKKESLSEKILKQSFDFACIITAYKNIQITQPLVISLLKQSHPNFHIYLVADACDANQYPIEHNQLTVLFPCPSLNLKAQSIIYAVERFVRSHDYIAIFDADNVAHLDFLKEINKYAQHGHKSIQGQRTAKNLNTKYACADATGEFYKNYVERYAPYLIGTSSVISGSGMAVESTLYKAYLYGEEIQKGKHLWKKMLQEDKILQNFLVGRQEKIAFAKTALIYDEKVTKAAQVKTQRSRWLYSYFQNIPNSLNLARQGIKNLDWNQFYFGLLTFSPPLFILLFASLLLMGIGLFIKPIVAYLLLIGIVVFATTILWTLYLSNAPKVMWRTLWGIPFFIWQQFTALFKMGNPNKNFKHSEHSITVEIEKLTHS